MALPRDLILVRHGESEGNVAIHASREGNDRFYTDAFRACHSAHWRLTPTGCKQAELAGEWIVANFGDTFDGYFVSELLRAKETAAYLKLPYARWRIKSQLIERSRGHLDIITRQERRDRFPEELALKERFPYLWTPPGGESIADVRNRLHAFLGLLHREFDGKTAIVVVHGEIIDAFRMILEFLPLEEYNRIRASSDDRDHTHNCQIIHYTRRTDPNDLWDHNLTPYLGWVRSVWPLDPTKSRNGWQAIERKTFSNNDLLTEVERTPRLFSDK